MTTTPFYWVDAFTNKPFEGNPAAVVPLQNWLPDEQLQKMAWQHGLSETVFYVSDPNGRYHLRWFTPAREVDLCGHATVAAATVIFHRRPELKEIQIDSQSGPLTVRRDESDRYQLEFPSRPPTAVEPDQNLLAVLGIQQTEWTGKSRDHFVVLANQTAVADLTPDFEAMAAWDATAVIVTAPGNNHDYVSRHFAPGFGIDEDPVTGSAQCTLIPYWADRLGKTNLHARQISKRGGEIWGTMADERVKIAGNAVIYIKGELTY